MKKILLLIVFALSMIEYASAQSFSNYYKDGMYKFDDNFKLMKSDVFSTYKSYFGFNSFNDMVMTKEDVVDTIGTTAGTYIQYERGYPIEGTMMHVISKYGVVLFVNGFSLPKLNVDVSSPITEATALT